jgi:hypothetical protein
MKYVPLFVLFAATLLAAVDLTKPIPVLALSDGRILKNVTFANFKTDTVLLRHAGGSTLLRYEFLPDGLRDDVEAKRPGGPRSNTGVPVSGEKTKLSGQLFVTTRGAGAYKFSGITVYAFPMEAYKTWEQTNVNPVELPRPIVKAVTDADGKFSMMLAKGEPFFLFAQASRFVSETEKYDFRVPHTDIKSMDAALMTNEHILPHRPVKIDGN